MSSQPSLQNPSVSLETPNTNAVDTPDVASNVTGQTTSSSSPQNVSSDIPANPPSVDQNRTEQTEPPSINHQNTGIKSETSFDVPLPNPVEKTSMTTSNVTNGFPDPPNVSISANSIAPASQPSLNPDTSTHAPVGGEGGTSNGANWVQDDVDQLQDVLGSSGVDLRAEENAMYRRNLTSAPNSFEQARNAEEERASSFYLELMPLSYRVHKIAQMNGLYVDADVLQHISSAAKIRFRNLIESMVSASRHRQWSSHLRPPPMYGKGKSAMYHEEIEEDPSKLLSVLARVEKAQEQAARQRRMQREEQEADLANSAARGEAEDATMTDGTQVGLHQSSLSGSNGQANASQTSIDGVGNLSQEDAKRKVKKPGISTAARNMTEDKRLRLANNTAAQAMGLSAGSKAWMFGGGSVPKDVNKVKGGKSGSSLPAPRFGSKAINAQGNAVDDSTSSTQNGANGTNSFSASSINPGGWGDLAARQRHREEEEQKRKRIVNLDDALHALEMERKGGAGRGSGERVLYVTRVLGRPTIPTTNQGQI